MTYFCPSCLSELDMDYKRCPFCGCDISVFSEKRDFVDKLLLALHHPEPSTPVRAAWILGQLREMRAIGPLYEIARETGDAFLRVAAIKALIAIGTAEASEYATNCLEQVSEVERLMVANDSAQPDIRGKKEQANGSQ